MRQTRPYTYLGTVQGMCRQCGQLTAARIIVDGGSVYQERLCPTCGSSRAMIAADAKWYSATMQSPVQCRDFAEPATMPVKRGCPHDCGPCAFHANAPQLPVFSITNRCNMACPICFTYNGADEAYFMSRAELRRLLEELLRRSGRLDLVNITGGEPTLHPDLLSLIEECHRPEIGRVTVNSNGLRLADNERLCEGLAQSGACVVLSLHALAREASMAIHGRDVTQRKLAALENLRRFGIPTTLLHVMIDGVNDGAIADVLSLAQSHSVVRSVTVQTMTFTGQGGGQFGPRRHVPLDLAAARVSAASGGQIRPDHFFPHPNAHPLCYSVGYFLRGRPLRSFTDFLDISSIQKMFGGGYLLDPADSGADAFRVAMDRLWADGSDSELLARLRRLIDRVYPPGAALNRFQRQRAAEADILTIYLHSHMDEDTLDLSRLCVCPDQVPDADGRLIPACAYNLFYRRTDSRFWTERQEGAGRTDAS